MKKYYFLNNEIVLLWNNKFEGTLRDTSSNRAMMAQCWGEENLISSKEGTKILTDINNYEKTTYGYDKRRIV